jgi:hypothetical protein
MTSGTVILLLLALFIVFIIAKGRAHRAAERSHGDRALRQVPHHAYGGFNILIPIFDKPREIVFRFTRDLPDGNKYVQFVKKERIDLRETVYDFPRRT